MAETKRNAKKALDVKNLSKEWDKWLAQGKRELAGLLQNLAKFRDIEKNNYELGHRHLALGNLSDAIFRFKFVTYLNPNRYDAWYYLGCSYLADNKKKKAKEALEMALKMKPEYEEPAYMLALVVGASLPPEKMPRYMPLTLAREYFDTQAPTFNADQLETRGYEGHKLLCNGIRSQLVVGRIDHTVLELGIGTGLCGPLIRDVASHISGVDISARMLAEAMKLQDAQGKKIYDALIERDMAGFVKDAPEGSYDIVMAASSFSYIGGLHDLFAQCVRVLKPGGLLAFTADKSEGTGYMFDTATARFRFSAAYLDKLGAEQGLTKLKADTVALYPDSAAWLYVYRK